MAYTQDDRHISITTPLGKDVLLLRSFSGQEAMSQLFSFDLELLSEVNPAVDFDAIVGKNVTLAIKQPQGVRYINGIVRRFSQRAGEPPFAYYRAEIVPWLWLLTQTADCRIFQNMSVPDILKKIFGDLGFTDFKFNLVGAFPPREYCVQYRETDFNFVCRLMEQYGIYYFFEHVDGRHTLVLANTPDGELECKPSAVDFQATTGATVADDDVVSELTKEQEIRPGKWSMTDYNFETPSVKLAVSVDSVFPQVTTGKFEVYDYPGEYQKRDEGDRLVKLRIEEEEARRAVLDGASGCRQFSAGHKFKLTGHGRADFDGNYVLTTVNHRGQETGYDAGRGEGGVAYENTFTCMPAKVPFRAPRVTARPVMQGSQTAEVVGPKGEEIYTDKFGRVKVQFHWDREGKKDENSSCWIRVSHPWAGKGWGSVSIPRIGQEVIVDFLEGDPDQPIITGRVYNGELMPPYPLPAGGVVSGLKSNSTKGGGGFNEISMNDTKGREMITIHGQYDMGSNIEHDQNWQIGNNKSESVGANESLDVGGSRSRSVGGTEGVTVALTRTHTVGVNEAITVGGAQEITVGGLQAITVGARQDINVGVSQGVSVGTNRSTDIGGSDELSVAKSLAIDAGDEIQLKAGDASITMKKDGTIIIKGKDITVEGSGKLTMKASKDVTIKGQKILEN